MKLEFKQIQEMSTLFLQANAFGFEYSSFKLVEPTEKGVGAIGNIIFPSGGFLRFEADTEEEIHAVCQEHHDAIQKIFERGEEAHASLAGGSKDD